MAATGVDEKTTKVGMWDPLRLRFFRALWSANLVSNFGWLIQGVGAAWLMTSLSSNADMVALVQTAVQLPIVCISLFAGVAADIFDRRAVLIVAQLWMLANAVLLAALAGAGIMGPWLLLILTFSIGVGNAMQGPAFQASVREVVPVEQLAAAVTLSAIAFNLARTVGPALGGGIVAASGAEGAFIVNAVSYLGMIVVLFWWRRPRSQEDLPRERIPSAILTGVRYVAETSPIRRAAMRSAVFAFAASASLALLPLVARNSLDGGPVTYGLLLGAFGAGAMAGAFLVHPMRQRFGPELLVTSLSLLFGVSLVVLGMTPLLVPGMVALAVAGCGWLGCFSSFNISVQTSSAFWVQARVFAIYQTAMFAAMASGSWLWGLVAEYTSLAVALTSSGIFMIVSTLLHFTTPLMSGPAPDFRPSKRRIEPTLAFPFNEEEGPVLVLAEYKVSTKDARAFARAMDEVGHLRKRNGAATWRLFQDVADAEHWSEAFTVASWLDYRRAVRRSTAADEAIEEAAVRYHLGDEPPLVRHMVARKLD